MSKTDTDSHSADEKSTDGENETSDLEPDDTTETSETLRILLIEDNPGDARLIEEMLKDTEELAQRVRGDDAASGTPTLTHKSRLEEGLAVLTDTAIDIVLLDLNLPDSSGLETLESVMARVTRRRLSC